MEKNLIYRHRTADESIESLMTAYQELTKKIQYFLQNVDEDHAMELKVNDDYVISLDEKEFGSCHEFLLTDFQDEKNIFGWIKFQKGPRRLYDKNGIDDETLLLLVHQRISDFQKLVPCKENQNCLYHLEEAMLALRKRSRHRQQRGVEGTMKE